MAVLKMIHGISHIFTLDSHYIFWKFLVRRKYIGHDLIPINIGFTLNEQMYKYFSLDIYCRQAEKNAVTAFLSESFIQLISYYLIN